MKTCPQCGTAYSDDTREYCQQDGRPLTGPLTDAPTAFLGEEETVAARRGGFRVPIEPELPGQRLPEQVVPLPKSSNTVLIVTVTAFVMLLLFGIAGLAAFVYFKNSQQVLVQNTTVNTRNGTPAGTPPPQPTATARVLSTATPAPTQRVTPADTPPPVRSNYPDTTRLKFSRGAYSTSFSGDVNAGDTRSLVLSCRYGQELSANISSAGGCVTFRGGGSSVSTTTSGGDNYLTVTNRCSSVARFSISITVI
jgi:hypothetical protein